jgi:hypothetical protein
MSIVPKIFANGKFNPSFRDRINPILTIGKVRIKKCLLKLCVTFFEVTTWQVLMTNEHGSKIDRASLKLLPNKRRVGVPKTSRPTPNIDWTTEKMNITKMSTSMLKF